MRQFTVLTFALFILLPASSAFADKAGQGKIVFDESTVRQSIRFLHERKIGIVPGKPARPGRLAVCHKPGTNQQRVVWIGKKSIPKHLRHGDYALAPESCDSIPDNDCDGVPGTQEENDASCDDGLPWTDDVCDDGHCRSGGDADCQCNAIQNEAISLYVALGSDPFNTPANFCDVNGVIHRSSNYELVIWFSDSSGPNGSTLFSCGAYVARLDGYVQLFSESFGAYPSGAFQGCAEVPVPRVPCS